MNCPNGYYNSLENISGLGNLCVLCDVSCLICIGSPNNCLSCGNVT